MSKYYAQWRRPKRKERRWKIHPIWGGIGCVMLVMIPIFSFLIADWGVEENFTQQWIVIPPDLLGPPGLPIEYLYAKLAFTMVITVILFGGYTLIYGVIYSIAGPSRYGPQDVPPLKRKRTTNRKRGGRY